MDSQQHEAKKKRRRQQDRRRHEPSKQLPGFPVTLGGRTYYLSPPDRDGIREMERFILANRRSPLEIAKANLDGLTPDQQVALLKEALAHEPLVQNVVSEREFAAACDSREGAAMIFWLMIRKNHPDMTLERIDELVFETTEEEFRQLLAKRDDLVA